MTNGTQSRPRERRRSRRHRAVSSGWVPGLLMILLSAVVAGGCHSREESSPSDPHSADDHGDDHGESSRLVVELSDAAIQNADLDTAIASTRTMAPAHSIPAEVTYVPDRIAHVSAPAAGVVASIAVTVGDRVEKGERLLTIRSVEIGRARAALRRARSEYAAAEKNYERQRQLRAESIASERALLDAELSYAQARASLSAVRAELAVYGGDGGNGGEIALSAPIAGTVIERNVTLGESVSSSTTLMIIADTESVWVIGSLHGPGARGRKGVAATFSPSVDGGGSVHGTIDYVSPVARGASRAVEVRMELGNESGLLRPGEFGTLSFDAPASTMAPDGHEAPSERETPVEHFVAVPNEAVQAANGGSFVFVPGEDAGTFEAIPVATGESYGGYTAIIAGLTEGTTVVTRGAYVLKSELVREQMGHGHAH